MNITNKFLIVIFTFFYFNVLAEEIESIKSSERIAYFFYQKGDIDRAIEEYEHISKKNPNNPLFHYNLGCLYAKNNYYYLAIKEFRKAIETDSSVKNHALYNLAVIFGKYLNDTDSATKYYREFMEAESQD